MPWDQRRKQLRGRAYLEFGARKSIPDNEPGRRATRHSDGMWSIRLVCPLLPDVQKSHWIRCT